MSRALPLTLFAAALFTVAGFVACGSTPPGSDGGTGLTAESACAALASARCARIDACTNGNGVVRRYGDRMTCEARERTGCLNNLGAPQTAATPASVAACAAALPTQGCADFENGVLASACVPPAGVRANGAPCAANAQCQSTYCAIPRGQACGFCAAPPTPGQSCVSIACARGLTCTTNSQVCVTPGTSNAACATDSPCGFALSCQRASDGGSEGSCKPAGGSVGAACDFRRLTAPECDRALGLFCNPATRQCAALTPVAAGAPCGFAVDGGEGVCTSGGVCYGATARSAGQCGAAAAEGGNCDLEQGPPCLTPARCVVSDGGTSGTCQIVSPARCQ